MWRWTCCECTELCAGVAVTEWSIIKNFNHKKISKAFALQKMINFKLFHRIFFHNVPLWTERHTERNGTKSGVETQSGAERLQSVRIFIIIKPIQLKCITGKLDDLIVTSRPEYVPNTKPRRKIENPFDWMEIYFDPVLFTTHLLIADQWVHNDNPNKKKIKKDASAC